MTFTFDALSTLTLAVLCLLLGMFLKRRSAFLQRFCIPAPVIGGFLVSLLIWLLHAGDMAQVKFNTALQSPLMVAFFVTVGLGGSVRLLKTGGKLLIIYLVICWGVALFQNTFGALLAHWLGINPVLGVMAGAVSLEGGHGAAAVFGKMAEDLGVQSATIVAIASATFGLIAGGLLGGPIADFLIRKHKVPVIADTADLPAAEPLAAQQAQHEALDSEDLLKTLALILVIMATDAVVVGAIREWTAFDLPGYVGAMLIAVIVRNLNDMLQILRINQRAMDLLADISLGIFLTMAMMSLRIWELYAVALPLFVILALQVLALVLFTVFVVFRLLGRNYDAAVMCAGLLGHGLGATPNAVANMSSVVEKYGLVSRHAFLIVPLCGAVLIDIVAIPYHAAIINFLTR